MRILLVNTYYDPEILGGAEISVQKLAEGLVSSGHEVWLLCSAQMDSKEIKNGVHVWRMKPNNLVRSLDYEKKSILKKIIFRGSIYTQRLLDLYNPFNYHKVKKIITQIHPDVVHTNNLYELSLVVWQVAHDLHIQVIHTVRDYYLLTKFGTLSGKSNVWSYKLAKFVRHQISRYCINKWVDLVTAPSDATLGVLQQYRLINGSKSKCIPNAIDVNLKEVHQFSKSNEIRFQDIHKPIEFIYLGTLTDFKGVNVLLHSFEMIKSKNVRLHIAGNGPLKDVVLAACEKDQRITYHGFLKEAQVNSLLQKCQILICPSMWEEPFGRVVLDAYKNGLIVVASDRGALPEVVNTGNTGYIFSSRVASEAVENLSGILMQLITDRRQGARLFENIPNKMADYTLSKQVSSFVTTYSELK